MKENKGHDFSFLFQAPAPRAFYLQFPVLRNDPVEDFCAAKRYRENETL